MFWNDPSACPYYLVSRVTLVVTSALKKRLAEAHVPQVKPAYVWSLINLWNEDGLKVVDLGRRSGLEASTMSGLLDRMERDGLVTRVPDPSDRRVLRITLTSEGKRVKKPVIEVVDRLLSEMFDGIPPEEIAQTTSLLQRVLEKANRVNE
jgi:DNA-binding MarR family transcriptional regulator